MKRQLDLIPYFKAPLEYPMKMFKRIEEAYNPETKRLDSAYDDLKEAQNRVEVLQFLKDVNVNIAFEQRQQLHPHFN